MLILHDRDLHVLTHSFPTPRSSDLWPSQGEGGDATADNAAVADGAGGTHAHAGDDTISGSFGDDTVAGDALAAGDGSEALANNTATASGPSKIGRAHV